MTRQEIIDEGYEFDKHGIIQTLGKFEGEMLYAVHFYDAVLNGDGTREYPCENCECYGKDGCEADECYEEGWDVLDVTDEDRKEFPELGNAKRVVLEERENGFIYCTTK